VECINRLKKEARKLGGDAIMDIRDVSSGKSYGAVSEGTEVISAETIRIAATAIVFEE
jgi:uncharacterized protein YbjQ (UPF0145 family)